MTNKSKDETVETVNPEHEKLLATLKFTPRTYKIQIWGYGGEYVMGRVDRKIFNYFKSRRLNLSDFAWDSDYADEHNIPEEMWPFPPGSWYECDDMGHCHGVDRNSGTLQITDEQDQVIYERSLEDIDGYSDDSPELGGGDEVWIDQEPAGTVVFVGVSSEKGTFFEGEIPLTAPFDITKLQLCYDDIDGNEIINSVYYKEESIENWGGSTDGKSSDLGFYIAGSNKNDGKGFEKYRNMDDIDYTMTDWFPKKTQPVREGIYNIRTPGKDSYTYQAKWTGAKWTNTWSDEEIKIKEWQGIAYDPDEQDLRDELDSIILEAQ